MLRLAAKLGEIWGFSPLVFVRGHFQEIGIAALPIGLKECRLTGVGESELTDKKETCTEHKIAFAERAI